MAEDTQFSSSTFCFPESGRSGLHFVGQGVWSNSCNGHSIVIQIELGSLGSTQYDFDADDKLIGVSVRDYSATDPCRSMRHYGKTCWLESIGCPVATGVTEDT